jgi:hypothetical protein
MQTAKGKKEHSIERKMFKTLKEFVVELSSYHGGSLNRKDVKEVMNNATYFLMSSLSSLKLGTGPAPFFPMRMLKRCACILERCLFYGMGNFC